MSNFGLKHILKRTESFCIAFSAAFAAVSCIGVDYAYVDEGNGAPEGFGKTPVSLNFDWTGKAQENIPGQMSVLMARKRNEIHYVWRVDSTGKLQGDDAPLDTLLRNGDYLALAVNVPATAYKTEGLDKFASDRRYPLTSLSASLEVPAYADFNSEFGIGSSELCPEYAPVVPAEPIWHSFTELSLPGNSQETVLSFSPTDLTLELDVRLRIKTVSGAEVKSVTAVLSGVPRTVSLMRGTVSDGSMYKVAFKMAPEENAADGKPVLYSGKVRTLGLFSEGFDSYLAGPGILWLAIDATAGQVSKRLYAGINMKYYIRSLELMNRVDNLAGYRLNENSAVLDNGAVLTVDGNKIISGDNAVEPWNMAVHENQYNETKDEK